LRSCFSCFLAGSNKLNISYPILNMKKFLLYNNFFLKFLSYLQWVPIFHIILALKGLSGDPSTLLLQIRTYINVWPIIIVLVDPFYPHIVLLHFHKTLRIVFAVVPRIGSGVISKGQKSQRNKRPGPCRRRGLRPAIRYIRCRRASRLKRYNGWSWFTLI